MQVLLNSLGNFVLKCYVRKELLNLKGSKLGQILRADKTGFCRLGHIFYSNKAIHERKVLDDTKIIIIILIL